MIILCEGGNDKTALSIIHSRCSGSNFQFPISFPLGYDSKRKTEGTFSGHLYFIPYFFFLFYIYIYSYSYMKRPLSFVNLSWRVSPLLLHLPFRPSRLASSCSSPSSLSLSPSSLSFSNGVAVSMIPSPAGHLATMSSPAWAATPVGP